MSVCLIVCVRVSYLLYFSQIHTDCSCCPTIRFVWNELMFISYEY